MKRFLAFVLTVVLLLSTLSGFASAATISFLVNPSVFVAGDVYNVIWVTNEAGLGYVEYTYQNAVYRVYDEKNGVVRTDDTIHTVQIPKEHLDTAGSYTVYSQLVSDRNGYSVTLGNSISVTRTFQGYYGQDEINAWVVTDPHGLNPSIIKSATSNLSVSTPDILFMLGDLITFTYYKQVTSNSSTAEYWNHSLCYIFRLAETLTSGTRPVVFARGNHETRAAYSPYVTEYLAGDTGELYFDFTYGPISSIVLDYGEDKIDTHHEYTGFADFENYHKQQAKWVSTLGGYPEEDTAEYKIALVHGNDVDDHAGADFMTALTEYGTDMMFSGHTHCLTLYVPTDYELAAKTVDSSLSDIVHGTENDDGTTSTATMTHYVERSSGITNFPHLINGCHYTDSDGNAHFIATQLKFKDGQIITSHATDTQSTNLTFTVNAGLNEKVESDAEVLDPVPATYKQPDYYTVNDDDLVGSTSTPNDSSFSFITKPAVFDTGDNYTVVWATSEGEAATGEVRVHVDGTVYKFTDSTSGYYNFTSNTLENLGYAGSTVASTKNIHSVVVPKEYLEKGKYECVSRHLMSVGYTTNLELGYEITTGLISFDGYDEGEEVEMMVVSQWDKADKMVSKLRTLAKTADVIVVNGDIAERMQSDTDFVNMIYEIASLSNGKKPVYFVRGNKETVGNYGAYLMKNIKSSSYEFFTKVQFGPVTSILLDTAADFDDSYAGYNGLASFATTRVKQLQWLKEQSYGDSEYNLVFSNSAELFNYHGTDYNKVLNNLGTDLAVFSNTRTSYFNETGTRGQNYATAGNGTYAGDGTVATVITFADGTITAKAINSDGSAIVTNTVDTSANTAAAFADVEDDAWYAEAVSYASAQTLMVGVSENTFAPEEAVTRGQAAVVLAAAANADLENLSDTPFEDVDEDAYYADAVAWCWENKVTFGTSENTFSPEDKLTRQQLCALIVNLFAGKYQKTDDCDFADYDEISDYAKPAVAALAKAGVVVGVGNGKFSPKSTVTRAQLAQILYAAEM